MDDIRSPAGDPGGAAARSASVVALAQQLVRLPSRGGIDGYGPVLGVVESWLGRHGVAHRRLHDGAGHLVGLVAEVAGAAPGPWWTLDACLDTAPFGDEGAWSYSPTSGEVRNGWLLGRGAADSKLAAAMFCHIAAELGPLRASLRGGLAVLLDVDEHTGNFGGARAYLADPATVRPAGVMIGYPGPDEIVVGGRGLWRATVHVHGASGHSGARRTVLGAVTRAARLVQLLDALDLPGPVDGPVDGPGAFPLPPKVSVTAIHGGEGFSTVPGLCVVSVDVRTTPLFTAEDARAAILRTARTLDAELLGPRPTAVEPVTSWPPFRLRPDEEPAAALLRAADASGLRVRPKTAGPSNIGNYLAGEGIPATAGFGVGYEGLHGIDERARITDLPQVHATYRAAVLDLLQA